MSLVLLYFATVILFLGLDILGLRFVVKPVFDRDIGHLLLESPRYGPALIFYLFYVAGLLWFVSAPALRDGTSLPVVFALGAAFGAIGYGTYEFSNMATLKGWTWRMLTTDLLWGMALTGISATGGLAIATGVRQALIAAPILISRQISRGPGQSPGRPTAKAGGIPTLPGDKTVTPTAPARASAGSSDIGTYSPRRHNSP
jgi:uncharacterized membrane protein